MTFDRSFSRAVLGPLLAIAAILLIGLLPDLSPHVASDNQAVDARHGRIVEIVPRRADEAFRPPFANVQLLDGPHAGETVQAYLEGPGGSQIVANYQPGDEVVVTTTLDASGQPYVAVSDRWRAPLLGAFVLLFAVAVVVVGGIKGSRALLALGLTIAFILKVFLPLVIAGYAPVPLAVVTATAVTVVTILLTEGWSRASAAAILGTSASLALSGLLGAAATALASFTYSAGSDLAFLQTSDGNGLDLRGLLLGAFILGAVGVLDDVTVTQAKLIEQLEEHGAHGGRAVPVRVRRRSLAHRRDGQHALPRLCRRRPATPRHDPDRQQPAGAQSCSTPKRSRPRSSGPSWEGMGILAAVPLTTFIATSLVDEPGAAGSALRPGPRNPDRGLGWRDHRGPARPDGRPALNQRASFGAHAGAVRAEHRSCRDGSLVEPVLATDGAARLRGERAGADHPRRSSGRNDHRSGVDRRRARPTIDGCHDLSRRSVRRNHAVRARCRIVGALARRRNGGAVVAKERHPYRDPRLG